jgi:hypothetical protein
MTKLELDNLVKIGQLKSEPGTRAEFDGMVASARKRLVDARNESLAPESRFDLAYGAAHGVALAALRQKGYRSENRYTVFQALVHTILLPCESSRNATTNEIWRNMKAAPRLMSDFSRNLSGTPPTFRKRSPYSLHLQSNKLLHAGTPVRIC